MTSSRHGAVVTGDSLRDLSATLDELGLLNARFASLDLTGPYERARARLGDDNRLVRYLRQRAYLPRARTAAPLHEVACSAYYRLRGRLPNNNRLGAWRARAVNHAAARQLSRLGPPPAAVFASAGSSTALVATARAAGMPAIVTNSFDGWGLRDGFRRAAALAPSPREARAIGSEWDLERWVARRNRSNALATHVIVHAGRTRERLLTLGLDPDRVLVSPNSVDIERFRPAPRDGGARPLRAVLVGRATYWKGVHIARDAVRLSGDAVEDLTVIGVDPPGGEPVREGAPKMRFTGLVPFAEVQRQLQRADVCVLPTLADMMPRAVLEAMASGLPVITTDESGFDDIIEDGVDGFIVPVHDAQAVAERLQRLAGDPDLRTRIGRAARATAEDYSHERHRERLRALLTGPLGPALRGEWREPGAR